MESTVGIGLLGYGTVGSRVADRLRNEQRTIERGSGVRFELRAVAIRDPAKARPNSLERHLFTVDARAVVEDPHVDLIVELIGGVTDAADLVEHALYRGRHVVTANKDLLATQGPRLAALAASRGAALRCEAAVAGAIPLVRTLDEGLAGDEIFSVAGVVNGTATAILSAMEDGSSFAEALAVAQRAGYAESDPSNDLDGTDAAHKLAIIAQRAFGLALISPRIRRRGIANVTQRDIARAKILGLRLRLVAAVFRNGRGLLAEVAPVLIPQEHDFARTGGAENVVHVTARHAQRLVLGGFGAGGAATSSAVVADVISVLRAVREARDLSRFGNARRLEPVVEVEPFTAQLEHISELPDYPLWSDSVAEASLHACASA